MIDGLNNIGVTWADYFGPVLVQNTVFLGLVWIALYLMRKASARARYIVALVGIAKLLLPPFVPIRMGEATSGMLVPLSSLIGQTAPLAGTVPAQPLTPTPESLELVGLLFLAWSGLILLYLFATLISTVRLATTLRTATDITGEMPALAAGNRGIRLYKSDRIAMPMTVGILPRRIFVPAAWDHWTADCRMTVTQHEAAHIRRRDGLFELLQILVQAFYWFHPLVWLLNRRIREYREMACDDASIGVGHDSRLRYSKHLVEIAESAVLSPLTFESVSALVRRKHELLNRIRYQMKEGNMKPFPKTISGLIVVGLVLFVLPLSGYVGSNTSSAGEHLASADQQADKPQKSGGKHFINIQLTGAETVALDGNNLALDKLKVRLDDMVGDDREHVIIRLTSDEETPMATMFAVHDILSELDLLKVAYTTGTDADIPLVLPSEHLRKKIKEIPDELIATLCIESSGNLVLDREKVKGSNLDKVIEQRLSQEPKLIVHLCVATKSTYGNYVSVLDQLRKAGAKRIHVSAVSSETQ
jgi:beta-lactamase regulating signal transducer with metallopeptidase domain